MAKNNRVLRWYHCAKVDLRYVKYSLQRWSAYRYVHLAYTGWRANHRGLPNWGELLNKDLPEGNDDFLKTHSERVLIATGVGGHLPSITIESILGVAFSQRSVSADFLLCDGILQACMLCEVNWYKDVNAFGKTGPADRCDGCYRPALRMLNNANLDCIGMSTKITGSERKKAHDLAMSIALHEIETYKIDGVSVGEHAKAGALRFFACGEIEDIKGSEIVLRRYFESALITYYVTKKVLSNSNYCAVVTNHGIYVPQGIIAETARQMGVRVVTWHTAYRKKCFIFNHNETYHHGLLTESVSSWENMRWNEKHRDQIEKYLRSRWTGEHDWVSFQRDPEFNSNVIEKEVGIDFSKPTVGLLTNVIWDAQIHYPGNVFQNMLDWLRKTIAYFKSHQNIQLLIRVHPAEVTGLLPSGQPVVEEIWRAFPQLPSNVFIIPPESKLSTYVAMANCNAALVYGTKMGVELAATGMPVIVAGEAWVRGKGVTIDAVCEADYFRILDSLPFAERLNEVRRERALKYAYHFFFRRMIPLTCVKERKGWPPFGADIQGLSDLEKGSSKGLDIICDGILENQPFIYHAEEIVL